MWHREHGIDTRADPVRIWALWSDVAGWPRWNAGVEKAVLNGPFADGSTFEMTVPGQSLLTSRLVDVRPNESFTDETVVGPVRVRVAHRIVPLSSDRIRITYVAEVEGDDAEAVGEAVSADFTKVLAGLKALAEQAP